MARPLEFDRDLALRRAGRLFWKVGYAGTSTADLTREMGIGRQSLYNSFGDKQTLYREALGAYHDDTLKGHLHRLDDPASPLEGIRQLLAGLAAKDDETRALGCFGVTSINEFGISDPEVLRLASQTTRVLHDRILRRVREAKGLHELGEAVDVEQATEFILTTMTGLQVATRSGADIAAIERGADFAIELLARP